MSVEQAKAFLERVDADQALRESVKAAYTQDLVRIANENGFEVSVDDLNAVAAEMSDFGDELSLSQLEEVAGGQVGFSGMRIATDPAH